MTEKLLTGTLSLNTTKNHEGGETEKKEENLYNSCLKIFRYVPVIIPNGTSRIMTEFIENYGCQHGSESSETTKTMNSYLILSRKENINIMIIDR